MKPAALVLLAAACVMAEERVDLEAVHRIRHEGLQRSKVMDHAFYLTDVYGPRLTGSPGLQAAGEWILRKYAEWGLTSARMETWGPFGRGWSSVRFSAHMKEPGYQPLIGFARPWSPSTPGPISAAPVLAVIRSEEDFPKFRGHLKGKIVLIEEPRELKPLDAPLNRVHGDGDLAALLDVRSVRGVAYEGDLFTPAKPPAPSNREKSRRLMNRIHEYLKQEGVAAVIVPGERMDGGTVRSSGPAFLRDEKNAAPPPLAALTPEHYNQIARLVGKKVPVTLDLDIQTRFHQETRDSFNVVGEIPGGDKSGEFVMLGAHLDSWTGGTGATDNAAGSSVVMEAMRILKATGLKPRRTIRAALWSGEEQGLLGSKAYVAAHFADPETMDLRPEHGKLAAYFNLDNGSGMIRGVYLQGNDMVRPIFEAWLRPFHDLGAKALTIRNTFGTDHLSFDAVGLPGFQFIQDPLEYSTRTHHTNMDVYDHLQRNPLQQAATVMASFVYHAAMREEKLPRKPLPEPRMGEGLFENILFSKAGGESLTLDAYLPGGSDSLPAAIVVHGGGFVRGDKQMFVQPILDSLIGADLAVFSVNYRLAPKHRYPAAVEDVEKAVEWVRANAKRYRVDPDRVVLVGESAGGYLVDMAGIRGRVKVRGVVSFYAPHDFRTLVTTEKKVREGDGQFHGITDPNDPRWKDLSPISLVKAAMPPFLLIHGTQDAQVPYAFSPAMCEAMARAGASCELYTVEGGGHGVNGWEKSPSFQGYKKRMTDWVKEALKE